MALTVQFPRQETRTIRVAAQAAGPASPPPEETLALSGIAERLHPSDTILLIRIIRRAAELERTLGEAAAVDMLETALARLHGAEGRA